MRDKAYSLSRRLGQIEQHPLRDKEGKERPICRELRNPTDKLQRQSKSMEV